MDSTAQPKTPILKGLIERLKVENYTFIKSINRYEVLKSRLCNTPFDAGINGEKKEPSDAISDLQQEIDLMSKANKAFVGLNELLSDVVGE